MAIERCIAWSVLVLGGLSLAVGCGKEQAPLCRVTGKVLVAGKPTADLVIRFQSLDDPTRQALPDATTTEPDGTFSLLVKGPGEYGLTALWPMVTVIEGERFEGEDRFGGRYNNLQQPIQRFTVSPGDNVVPDINL